MYRNYRHCSCNLDNQTNPMTMENSCSGVSNVLDMYYNECECGYDNYSYFPENPVLRTKLCSNSKNERNFYPSCWTKNGYDFSRTC